MCSPSTSPSSFLPPTSTLSISSSLQQTSTFPPPLHISARTTSSSLSFVAPSAPASPSWRATSRRSRQRERRTHVVPTSHSEKCDVFLCVRVVTTILRNNAGDFSLLFAGDEYRLTFGAGACRQRAGHQGDRKERLLHGTNYFGM